MQIIPIGNISDFEGEFRDILAGIEEGLDEVANEIKGEFLRPTSQWEHKPEFQITRTALTREIFTEDANYIRINDGTHRTGYTVAKGGRHLHLPSRFIAKTHPGDLFGYGGVREYERGKNVFRMVRASSIRPRHWDEWIVNLWTNYNDIGDFIQRRINAK